MSQLGPHSRNSHNYPRHANYGYRVQVTQVPLFIKCLEGIDVVGRVREVG